MNGKLFCRRGTSSYLISEPIGKCVSESEVYDQTSYFLACRGPWARFHSFYPNLIIPPPNGKEALRRDLHGRQN